ncbi:MAG: MFS transporter [Alphaproteobacteria bacterium]|nr:MFS transporter [Alphaproteobacteria bacterium]
MAAAKNTSPAVQLAAGWMTMFAIGTDLFVVSPLLPLIASGYRISATQAGLAVTAFAAAYMVVAPVCGSLADRWGRRRVLCLGLLVFAAGNLATAVAPAFPALLAARLLAGAAAAAVSPSVYALVGEAAPPARRASRLALVVSGLLLSLSVGTPLGALLGTAFGWPIVFIVLTAASLALAAVNLRAWPAAAGGIAADAGAARLTPAVVARRTAPTVIWSTALYGMYTYLGAGLAGAGYSADATAGAIAIYGAGALGGTFLGGAAADRLGTRPTIGAGLFGLAVGLMLLRLGLVHGAILGVALFFVSVMAQLFFPAQQAGLARDFPARRATMLAWNNSALFFGISLGSLVGGTAMAVAGFGTDLWAGAAIATLGWLLNGAVLPRRLGMSALKSDRDFGRHR